MFEEGYVFEENTTLFALWQAKQSGSKLRMPAVRVDSASVRWDAVDGATLGYRMVVKDSQGTVLSDASNVSLVRPVDFASMPAGDYTIEVTALASLSVNNSDTTVRYFRNKALTRVSLFSVAEPSLLLFNEVENATKYLITIDCGDDLHVHTDFDNGTSTTFDFSACPMQSEGIRFTVTAIAEGFASSTSRTFVYNRLLSSVTGFYVDEATQTLSWNAVANATNYIIGINDGQMHGLIDNGSSTSFSLKNYSKGEILISIYPLTIGWNYSSPAASEYTYNKTTIATPSNIKVEGNTVSWPEVTDAIGYLLKIDDQTFTPDDTDTFFDIPETVTVSANSTICVMAKGSTAAIDSLWSQPIFIGSLISNELRYDKNTVFWNYVVGATGYEVSVNDGEFTVLISGENFGNNAIVTLTKPGINTIAVRAIFGEEYSEWANIEVYAHTVIFETQEGTQSEDNSYVQYYATGDTIFFPETTRTGYSFSGWYYIAEGGVNNGEKFNGQTFTDAGNIVLYAYWTPNTFTVTYEYGNGTGVDLEAHITLNEEFNLEVPSIDDGTGFVGWYEEENGQGRKFTDELGNGLFDWDVTEDITLYAYWAQLITFNESSGGREWAISPGEDIGLISTLVIPSEHSGLPVTELYPFVNCRNLVKVIVPASITHIDPNAFEGCSSLSAVEVANDNLNYCTTADGILFNKDMTVIMRYPVTKTGAYEIPNTVTQINYAFYGCTGLTAITIPDSVTIIGDYAFADCKGLTEVIIPETVTILGQYSFKGCTGLTEITIPESVTSIDTYAFSGCTGFTEIYIPGNVTILATYAFKGCSNLVTVTFGAAEEDMVMGTYAFNRCSKLSSVIFEEDSRVTNIGEYAFRDIKTLTQITLPNTILTIDAYAFYATGLTSIVIPNSVQVIGSNAFQNSASLESVTFAENSVIERLETYAFSTCNKLTTIVLPNSLVTLGAYAFNNCKLLATVTFAQNSIVETIGSYAFSGSSTSNSNQMTTITIPASVTLINSYAFSNCTKLASVNFAPNCKLETIGNAVFNACVLLTSITIPKSVKLLDQSAFAGCSVLASVNFEAQSTLETVGNSAFNNCVKLTDMVFPDSVTALGTSLFNGCTSLVSATLPGGITGFNVNMFTGCTKLTTVNVSANNTVFSSVDGIVYKNGTELVYCPIGKEGEITFKAGTTRIGDNAFFNCSKLTGTITIPATVTSIGESAFVGCTLISGIAVEAGNTYFSALNGVLYNNDKTTLIFVPTGTEGVFTVPASVVTISNYAVQNANKITGIVFEEGSNLTTIGDYAFYNCSALVSLTLPEGLTTIGQYAFSGGSVANANKVVSITIPASVVTIGTQAFRNSGSMQTLEIADGSHLLSIGEYAFYICSNLVSVNFLGSSTLETISASAFQNCAKLVEVHLPDDVKSIGNSAFASNTKLTTINLPKNLETLGDGVFASCTLINYVVIPASVTTIGTNVFQSWTANQVIFVEGRSERPETWNEKWLVSLGTPNMKVIWIDYSAEECSVQITYESATAFSLAITAKPGYVFEGWYIGETLDSTEATRAFTVQNNMVITPRLRQA